MLRKIPRLYLHRRAMLIYVATIVAPVCALLWLGLQSFERQRQAVQTLTTEKLEANPSDPRHILSVYGEGYKFVG